MRVGLLGVAGSTHKHRGLSRDQGRELEPEQPAPPARRAAPARSPGSNRGRHRDPAEVPRPDERRRLCPAGGQWSEGGSAGFPTDQWDLFFSGRYADDLITGRESDRIYTGFAVRRGAFDAVSKRDVPELSVRHTDGRPTRWGTEILVEKDGNLLRLMSVHLKSGCHGGSLEPATVPDCITLAAQRAPLEGWIDAAAAAQVPFVIVGDWNRRIDVHGQGDHLWGEIDDADPPGLDLWRLPFNHDSSCNSGFAKPIGFLVFDDRAWRSVNEPSFEEIVYDTGDWDAQRRTPSDHCPIVVVLDWPAAD
jgi:hypothetical protein